MVEIKTIQQMQLDLNFSSFNYCGCIKCKSNLDLIKTKKWANVEEQREKYDELFTKLFIEFSCPINMIKKVENFRKELFGEDE